MRKETSRILFIVISVVLVLVCTVIFYSRLKNEGGQADETVSIQQGSSANNLETQNTKNNSQSLSISSKNRANRNIGLPKASGYTADAAGWVKPDFKVNPEGYDMSDINDFMLAVFEAGRNRDKDFWIENLMLPGIDPTWGTPVTRSTREYKITKLTEMDVGTDRVPEDARSPDARYFSVGLLFKSDLDGDDHVYTRFIVSEQDGRFYIVGA